MLYTEKSGTMGIGVAELKLYRTKERSRLFGEGW